MKIRTMLLAATLTLGSLTAVMGLANTSTEGSQQNKGGISTVPTGGGTSTPTRRISVPLQCRNYGGQQDVSKNPDIINSTGKTIPSGKTLYWKSTDGDNGSVVLDKALAPGGKVGVNGKAGQSYTCTAWMAK
jgi:hypothetical protein